jgi:hypothetical protein
MASSSSNSDGISRVTRSRASNSDNDEGERPSKSMRLVKNCTDWPLPRHFLCSACCLYEDASPASKAKGPREKTHTADRFQCRKPWLDDPTKPTSYDLGGKNLKAQKIREYIINELGANAGRLHRATTTPDSVEHLTTKVAIDTLLEKLSPSSLLSSSNSGTDESDGRKVPKEIEQVELWTETVSSMGHEFVVTGIPITHCLIVKTYLQRLRNTEKILKELQSVYQTGRFAGGSPLMRAMTSIAIASCPALPLSQAANIIPLVVGATLIDLGVLNSAKVKAFAKSFPSETYLREMLFSCAAECVLQLGHKLHRIRTVFLSCDKGNKSGIGHFVKFLSWYDAKTTMVVKQLLDIDASEGLTDDCADAIVASLKKIGGIRLQGQTTDSGGGGVLDGLHRALEQRQLCRPGYLVASCSLHNLQLSVANPIKQTMGEGALEKKNVMQLIHSVYDLQECLDNEVWKVHVDEAVAFYETYTTTTYVGVNEGDRQFAAKWELVKTFRPFNNALTKKELARATLKIPKPVLTRWWTVGETARVTWSAFLLLLRISQQVINATVRKENKIASGLQPLLVEAELFSDLALIHCFHSFYVCPHFAWMQEATDLSAVPGFQAHNTVARYFLLVQDLSAMASGICTTHPSFKDFRLSLNALTDQVQAKQKEKASTFVSIALEAVHKHFVRWCNSSLLPAALLSEKPLSIVVAAVMKGTVPPPVIAGEYFSMVHDRTIDIPSFFEFLQSKVKPDALYQALPLSIAERLLQDPYFDLREMDELGADKALKEYMYYHYLPLPSHTQFVEAGVKEARNVSLTDRSEQLRSAYAVIRSARVHSIEDLWGISSTQRIEALFLNALEHDQDQEQLRQFYPDYGDRIQDIARTMRQDHFKQERVDKLQQTALNKLHKNKKENQLQKKTGVDRTHTMEGLFPYGKLVQALHFNALKEELLFRGCTEEAIDKMKVTDRKNKLKELETDRLKDATQEEKTAATKAFKPLSGAVFPVA